MMLLQRARQGRITSINASAARNINRSVILDAIRVHQPISRSQISLLTKLNKSTVSSIVEALIAQDLVTEDIDNNHKIGRNPINLRVKKGMHIVGAVAIDSRTTELAIVDIDGTVKASTTIATEAESPRDFIAACLGALAALRRNFSQHTFNGIGFTLSGIVDSQHATVVFSQKLNWERVDIGALVRACDPTIEAVAVENDANACAMAELSFGTHASAPDNFIFLTVGGGIGAGIVVDKRILSGHSHAAGEFGHMTIVECGEHCVCGNRGCWESYASDTATIRRYALMKHGPADAAVRVSIDDVIMAAKANESEGIEALKRTGHYLGLGISNVIRAFNPEAVIIGGAVTECWDVVLPSIMDTLASSGVLSARTTTAILPTSLSAPAPLLGGAALSIRQIFTDINFVL